MACQSPGPSVTTGLSSASHSEVADGTIQHSTCSEPPSQVTLCGLVVYRDADGMERAHGCEWEKARAPSPPCAVAARSTLRPVLSDTPTRHKQNQVADNRSMARMDRDPRCAQPPRQRGGAS